MDKLASSTELFDEVMGLIADGTLAHVRRLVKGGKTRPTGEPVSAGQRRAGRGRGGGLPESPEARSRDDFGAGG